jgi:tryptophan synthase alpha chain
MRGTSTSDDGVARVAEAFERARADGRAAALMPYMMGGFPDPESSRAIASAYADAGADLIELGVPFSDPLADGPVIHAAATVALAAGTTLDTVLEIARTVSHRVPVILMCYVNPILARGIDRFLDRAVESGVSGLIVPDLPLEESGEIHDGCAARGLALVPLVAPTTPPERMAAITATARGFLYAVSVTGTTGERGDDAPSLAEVIARARMGSTVPVALGFGISTPAQAAAAAAAGADGVIVGSRLVRAAGESPDPGRAVAEICSVLAAALSDRASE